MIHGLIILPWGQNQWDYINRRFLSQKGSSCRWPKMEPLSQAGSVSERNTDRTIAATGNSAIMQTDQLQQTPAACFSPGEQSVQEPWNTTKQREPTFVRLCWGSIVCSLEGCTDITSSTFHIFIRLFRPFYCGAVPAELHWVAHQETTEKIFPFVLLLKCSSVAQWQCSHHVTEYEGQLKK